ncbi:hypothetical protein PHAVU_010G064600 [Phaseolus vulgaris]|uniref:Tf2-1-like SH3-like domain-containing protein n=1 Tax=Phaseolus vulgaris TaxID=3885 RepID=V7AMD9_PHAVU|nr:hypothetical protein PHAVU_010G064600g [Phaseolus vulgaris]ESW06639.1 hypothetical protein PHAVU_010G064600g [Phaseolus vulgaris]
MDMFYRNSDAAIEKRTKEKLRQTNIKEACDQNLKASVVNILLDLDMIVAIGNVVKLVTRKRIGEEIKDHNLRVVIRLQAPKYYGPLGIMGTVGQVAYKLLFPPGLCLYPVFHVSLSENAVGNY